MTYEEAVAAMIAAERAYMAAKAAYDKDASPGNEKAFFAALEDYGDARDRAIEEYYAAHAAPGF